MTDLLRQRNMASTADDRALSLDSIRRLQEQAAPVFVYVATFLDTVQPAITQIWTVCMAIWVALQPYHPHDLFVAIYGFFLVFFGGVFMTLVASVEAAHQFGWVSIKRSFTALYYEWMKARQAFERDNKVDRDRDGIADVEQLGAHELAARRLMVLTRSVDPQQVSIAIEGLTIALVAILATLRVRFAKAITLGTAIGAVLNDILSPFTAKALRLALPDEYEKWIPVMNKYGFRYIGVSASWVLMRIITSVFAAMKGSELFIMGVIAYLERHQYVRIGLFREGNFAIVGAWGALALCGIYLQISSSFRLPFPLNLLLLPLSIAEQIVIFAVGASAD